MPANKIHAKFTCNLMTALCLLFAIILVMSNHASASEFNDVQASHPNKLEITWCVAQNIINGYPDNTFRPDDYISNQAFQTMISRGFDINLNQDINANLTRYEAAEIINQIIIYYNIKPDEYELLAAEKSLKDFESIPNKYKPAIKNMYALDIMRGLSDKKFHGESNITRTQAAVILYRTASLQEMPLAMTPVLSNGEIINQENVNEIITELKSKYPNNTNWPGYNKTSGSAIASKNSIRNIIESYVVTGTKDDKCSTDTGCGGWAAFVLDYIFGQNAKYRKIDIDEIHPGDLMLKLDSANRLAHVQVYISDMKNKNIRISNANNGLGVPTAAGTTSYKIIWTNILQQNEKYDVYTAYPE